jgi:pyrroline-5-carboxylate reductase
MQLTIIGAGNLGSSIAKGIVSKDIFAEICVTRRNTRIGEISERQRHQSVIRQ